MSIENLIQNVPGWESLDAAAITGELNAVTEVIETNAVWTWQEIARIPGVGTEVVGKLHQALSSANLEPFAIMLCHPGLRLNDDLYRTVLRELISVVPETSAILSAAKRDGSPWQKAGNDGDVSEREITDALAKIRSDNELAAVRQAATDRWNAFTDAMDTWDGSGPTPVL